MQQDVKHNMNATLTPWDALLNTHRENAGKGKIVKAESNAQDTMYIEVPTQNAGPTLTLTEIQEKITAKTKCSAH